MRVVGGKSERKAGPDHEGAVGHRKECPGRQLLGVWSRDMTGCELELKKLLWLLCTELTGEWVGGKVSEQGEQGDLLGGYGNRAGKGDVGFN